MALPKTETFTNSNGTQLNAHDANWDEWNAMDINSNACTSDSPGVDCSAAWEGDTFNDDQYATATVIDNSSAASYTGLSVRDDGNGTFYGYYANSGFKFLIKYVSGSWTQLAGYGGASVWAATDIIRLEVEGTTITPIWKGSTDAELAAQTDAAIASGSAGVCGYQDSPTNRIDDWEGGNLVTGLITEMATIDWPTNANQLVGVTKVNVLQVAGVTAN